MYRLLVVDDEEKIRVLVRKYAEYEGYEVEEAADGMSAIELCRQEKFDLIILDVMMPELDGFSACREIHQTVLAQGADVSCAGNPQAQQLLHCTEQGDFGV